MAKRLNENLTSLYIEAANRLRSKQDRHKIVAYVESYDDIFFWRSVFDEFENDKFYFEVMLPSRTTLGKGKKIVLMNQLGPALGRYMVACVDADYDYLMQDLNSSTRFINRNPYVLHTYVYAIENYQCYAPSLHGVCVKATLNDRRMIDTEGFLRDFSRIVWPLFIWSVWAYRSGNYREFTLTDFSNIIGFRDVNLFHLERTLDQIKRRVNRKIAVLQRRFQQAKREYEPLKRELEALGVTPETTYLYIQGHTLFDNVVLSLLGPLCMHLRKEREREIRRLAGHDIQRQNELSGYQHSQTSIEEMLRKNTNFKQSEPFCRVRKDILNLLRRIETREDVVLPPRPQPGDSALPEWSAVDEVD